MFIFLVVVVLMSCGGVSSIDEETPGAANPPPSDNLPPVANVSNSGPVSGEAPLVVNFKASLSTDDNGIVRYTWLFGDGNISSDKNPTYIYDSPGEYTAQLIVFDEAGVGDSAHITINVTESLASDRIGVAQERHIQPLSANIRGGQSMVRRLTHLEYINSVRDTLAVDLSQEGHLLPDDFNVEGFAAATSDPSVILDRAQAYIELSELVVSRMGEVTAEAGLSHCDVRDQACQIAFIQLYGRKLYRRPLEAIEVAHLRTVFESHVGDFEGAAKMCLQVMLQAPQFLYQIEEDVGESHIVLSPYELASRLSYLIWNSTPDKDLMDAADEGRLSDAGELEQQIERMLNDSKAKAASERLFSDLLNLKEFSELEVDGETWPSFDSRLKADMLHETLDFIDRIVWQQDLPLLNIDHYEPTALSTKLTEYYGLDVQDREGALSGVGRVDSYSLSDTQRQEILTQASVFATYSVSYEDPSVVALGLFMLERALRDSSPSLPSDLHIGRAVW